MQKVCKSSNDLEVIALGCVQQAIDWLGQLRKHRRSMLSFYFLLASVLFAFFAWGISHADTSSTRKYYMMAFVGAVAYGNAVTMAYREAWFSLALSLNKNYRRLGHDSQKIPCLCLIADMVFETCCDSNLATYIKNTAEDMKLPNHRRNQIHNDLMGIIISRADSKNKEFQRFEDARD